MQENRIGTYRKDMRVKANRMRRVVLAHTFRHILCILSQSSLMFTSSTSFCLLDMLKGGG